MLPRKGVTRKADRDVSDDDTVGRRVKAIQYITDRKQRLKSANSTKQDIFRRAYELEKLTGAQVLLVLVSESKTASVYSSPGLRHVVDSDVGKAMLAHRSSIAALVDPDTRDKIKIDKRRKAEKELENEKEKISKQE